VILETSKGYIRSGEFLAIMGPSGAGKTTLLYALSQRQLSPLQMTSGGILLNNSNIQDISYK
jgi:ABC-type lipoprotein export system ATPase subunit